MNRNRQLVLLGIATLVASLALGAAAQTPSNTITCTPTFQPLTILPVLGSQGGVLSGNFYTASEQIRMTQRSGGLGSAPNCFPQWVRTYRMTQPSSWNPPASQT